ncbi:MAG: response regulator [Balneolales bacterium]|nr:response regulator [Balneolales bacterium]
MILWIIDDDSIYQMLMRRIIEKSHPHIQVEVFFNGKTALKKLESIIESGNLQEKPHTVFLDINMPVMDGWTFLESIRDEGIYSKLPFTLYIASSSIDHSDFRKAKTFENVSDYLVKPLSRSDLAKYLPSE